MDFFFFYSYYFHHVQQCSEDFKKSVSRKHFVSYSWQTFLGGEEIQFLFSLHCQPPEHEVSSPPLCCHSWRGLSCPLQPPHTSCALLLLQPQPGWCCHMAVRALPNAQLQLLLVQGAIARDKTKQGKWRHFAGNSSTQQSSRAMFRLPI